jgi:hypothetical protein
VVVVVGRILSVLGMEAVTGVPVAEGMAPKHHLVMAAVRFHLPKLEQLTQAAVAVAAQTAPPHYIMAALGALA